MTHRIKDPEELDRILALALQRSQSKPGYAGAYALHAYRLALSLGVIEEIEEAGTVEAVPARYAEAV